MTGEEFMNRMMMRTVMGAGRPVVSDRNNRDRPWLGLFLLLPA
jgi:hypothetical protein